MWQATTTVRSRISPVCANVAVWSSKPIDALQAIGFQETIFARLTVWRIAPALTSGARRVLESFGTFRTGRWSISQMTATDIRHDAIAVAVTWQRIRRTSSHIALRGKTRRVLNTVAGKMIIITYLVSFPTVITHAEVCLPVAATMSSTFVVASLVHNYIGYAISL